MANKSGSFQEQMNQVYLKDHVRHYSIRNTAEYPIYKIAITGGPCAGKSTSMEKIYSPKKVIEFYVSQKYQQWLFMQVV